MKPDEIKWDDWQRIFMGPVPPEFYIELVVRGLLFYLLLMVSMRMLGKRMGSRISRLEMVALVSLSSAVGVPLLSQMHGVLPPFIIALLIVGITRLITYLSIKSEKFEDVSQGKMDTLVLDGVMQLDTMNKVSITRQRLFSEIRTNKMNHLGGVKRMYMEANGAFSMVPTEPKQPGLLVLPDWDKEFIDDSVQWTDISICKACGEKMPDKKEKDNADVKCAHCGSNDWTNAVIEK